MTVYVVTKEGVYMQGCAGVFTDKDKAIEIAETCAKAGDGYHSWYVTPFEVDAPVPFVREDYLDEPRSIHHAQLSAREATNKRAKQSKETT